MDKYRTKNVITIMLFILGNTKAKLKEEEEELATEETVKYVFELSSTIETCLKDPSEENGNVLLRSLYEYYNNIDDVYWMVKENDKVKKNKGINFARQILENGLSSHLKTKINFDHLKVKFQWNDRSVQEVYDVIKDIKALWENLEFMYNELTFDYFDTITVAPPDC